MYFRLARPTAPKAGSPGSAWTIWAGEGPSPSGGTPCLPSSRPSSLASARLLLCPPEEGPAVATGLREGLGATAPWPLLPASEGEAGGVPLPTAPPLPSARLLGLTDARAAAATAAPAAAAAPLGRATARPTAPPPCPRIVPAAGRRAGAAVRRAMPQAARNVAGRGRCAGGGFGIFRRRWLRGHQSRHVASHLLPRARSDRTTPAPDAWRNDAWAHAHAVR